MEPFFFARFASAPGVTRFLSEEIFEPRGGGATQSPPVSGVGRFEVPILSGGELGGWQTPDHKAPYPDELIERILACVAKRRGADVMK